MSESTAPSARRTQVRTLALILGLAYVLVPLAFLTPQLALDGALGTAAVAVADSGSVHWLPYICVALLLVVISRPGLEPGRRLREGLSLLGCLLVFLAAMAWANEHLIKPAAAVPRPNIIALAESGQLGLEPGAFYALGDKAARRLYLGPRLDALGESGELRLAPAVRDHWVEETGYSFPSGHALAAMTFAAFFVAVGLWWLSGWRRILTLATPAWALAVIHSRPILRVHSAFDVSVGAAEGLVVGLLAFVLARLLIEGRAADSSS